MYDMTWRSFADQQRMADRSLNVRFYWATVKDGPASVREGRDIEVPEERVHIVTPAVRDGDTNQRAHAEWKKFGDEVVTYAMRFEDQYRRFRASEQQVASGTPIAGVQWLDGGQKATLKALDVHTVEQLAGLSGQALKNLGAGGTAWQQAAAEFLRTTKEGAEVTNLVRENAQLKESMAALAAGGGADPRLKYADMSDAKLKDEVTERSGAVPRGNPSRATLLRMLLDIERGVQAPAEAQAAA
jgi:hypothetical protein